MGACHACASNDTQAAAAEAAQALHPPRMGEPTVREASPDVLPRQEKLREVHALQRPRVEAILPQPAEPFQAKSEAAAEKRRLAERQERLLLLQTSESQEAAPEEKLRDEHWRSRMEAAEASHAAKEKAAASGRQAPVQDKLQEKVSERARPSARGDSERP
ncbi:unnamed protein product [Effrenium voratum]|nr:unnamed protein product [Effrenium voratum]